MEIEGKRRPGRPKKDAKSRNICVRFPDKELGMLGYLMTETGKNKTDLILELVRKAYYSNV